MHLSVYPRGCGELWEAFSATAHNLRFIPVGAGNSEPSQYLTSASTVYPRGCGELGCGGFVHTAKAGLSPWVRGTRRKWPNLPFGRRFIPVGAGNSQRRIYQTSRRPVYPRGCGELVALQVFNHLVRGLSPWVRGTLTLNLPKPHLDRFIPVGAGNSRPVTQTGFESAVYPRGCGELLPWVSRSITATGLSPWVRGTHCYPLIKAVVQRFIPVGAGNSAQSATTQWRSTVYPRGCGELIINIGLRGDVCGLSPWVRGTQTLNQKAHFCGRFIPVGAGNSSQRQPCRLMCAVYPRGCGELERV